MTTPSIPASQFVQIIPGTVGTGGSPESLNSVWLDTDTSIPIGSVYSFPSLLAVEQWFGANSPEAALAAVYFSGFIGCTQLPSALYFTQWNIVAVAAYLRGGSVASLSLAELQAFSGTLSCTINGTLYTTGSLNMSAATSFAEAATTIIQGGFTAVSAPVTATYDTLRNAFVLTSTTTGATSTITVCGGTLAADINLTTATGAVLSQGAAATTAANQLNTVVGVTQNWATFMSVQSVGTSVSEALALWSNQQPSNTYMYVPWDTNILATESPPQPTILAQLISAYNGVGPVCYDLQSGAKAAFVCGCAASINFSEVNGYTVIAAKSNALLTTDVTNQLIYQNLIANGYSAYCAIATANQNFQWFENGAIPGEFDWFDEAIFAIWLNSQLQLAGMELLGDVKSIPFNTQGQSLIYAAYLGPIQQGKAFGGIQTGIQLSTSQQAEVNQAAGANITSILFQQGFYLQIPIPSAQVQGARGPWSGLLFYTNAGGVQSLSLASIDVQ